jgi:hypothetical protein
MEEQGLQLTGAAPIHKYIDYSINFNEDGSQTTYINFSNC